jgi:hypothetical protein
MKVCGIDVDYNHYDTSNLKKFELNHEQLINEIQIIEKSDARIYQKSEKICELIINFFIDLLGEEQTNLLIENKKDMRLCINAFGELYNAINNDVNDTNKNFEKYSVNRVKHNTRRIT